MFRRGRCPSERGLIEDLHEIKLSSSWEDHGVLCAQKINMFILHTVATELGVQIHSRSWDLWGPAWNVSIKHMSWVVWRWFNSTVRLLKMVQIILGRWIFILQYRSRPAMAVLSRSWDYIRPGGRLDGNGMGHCTTKREVLVVDRTIPPYLQFDLRTHFLSPIGYGVRCF